MKTRVMYLSQADLAKYLNKKYKGFSSKQYELLVAFYLAKIISFKKNKAYSLAFPILQNTAKELGYGYSEEKVEKIFDTYIQEDTHVDVMLVPDHTIKIKSDGLTGKSKGIAFQIKKIVAKGEESTLEVVKYLKETIPKRYSKTDTSLLLIIQKPYFEGELDLNLLTSSLDFKEYPFNQILFLGGSGEETFFGELWPSFGYDAYSKEEFLTITNKRYKHKKIETG